MGWMIAMLLVARVAAGADKVDPLAKARTLYNQGDFEGAVSAAEEARRLLPARADSADLIIARANLERYRQSGRSDDLISARDRLRRIDSEHRDRDGVSRACPRAAAVSRGRGDDR